MSLLDRLQQTPLVCFIPSMTVLLDRFHGIEYLLPPEQTPQRELEAAIAQSLRAGDDAEALDTFRHGMASLTIFSIAVGAKDGPERWDPSCESLRQFEQRWDGVMLWLADRPISEPVQQWLSELLGDDVVERR